MLGPTPRRTTPPGTRLLGSLLTATLVVGAFSGCSDELSDSPAVASTLARTTVASPTNASEVTEVTEVTEVPGVAALRTKVRTGRITGQLRAKRRARLIEDVAGVTDRWFDAAYVAGDYPRTNFEEAFPGFTTGASRTAHRDRDLMTNADLGKRIDEVTVKRRTVTVDLLAVGGRARAATARVHLAFTTSGVERRVRVTGRLFLTQRNGRWRIFGYDVAKGRI